MTTQDEMRTMIDGLKQQNIRLHEGLAQLRQLCERLLDGLAVPPIEPDAGMKPRR